MRVPAGTSTASGAGPSTRFSSVWPRHCAMTGADPARSLPCLSTTIGDIVSVVGRLAPRRGPLPPDHFGLTGPFTTEPLKLAESVIVHGEGVVDVLVRREREGRIHIGGTLIPHAPAGRVIPPHVRPEHGVVQKQRRNQQRGKENPARRIAGVLRLRDLHQKSGGERNQRNPQDKERSVAAVNAHDPTEANSPKREHEPMETRDPLSEDFERPLYKVAAEPRATNEGHRFMIIPFAAAVPR